MSDQTERVYEAERVIMTRGDVLTYARARRWVGWALAKAELHEQFGVWQMVVEPLPPHRAWQCLQCRSDFAADQHGVGVQCPQCQSPNPRRREAEAGLAVGAERVGWMRLSNAVRVGRLVHELAHPLADARGAVGHDAVFVLVYLQLVRLYMGRSAESRLRLAFVRQSVAPCAPFDTGLRIRR